MILSNLWGSVMSELFMMFLVAVFAVLGATITVMGLIEFIVDSLDRRW
nr:MAG TPA: hypothetical protein [Caudoviricetes sp.]